MRERDDKIYLRHILDSMSRIRDYTRAVDYDAFCRDTLIQDAVIRQLEIVGEAVKRLSSGLRDKHSRIPWKDIAGMRDKLIHDYLGVDIDAVWATVQEDIPDLQLEIETVLREVLSERC